MAEPDAARERRIEEFRSNIAPDLYSPATFIPWQEVAAIEHNLAIPIELVQSWVDGPRRSAKRLLEAIETDSRVLDVLRYIFVAPADVGFADGREFPETMPSTKQGRAALASLAMDLGLTQLLPKGGRAGDVVRHGIVAIDARRRGFRRRDTVEVRVRAIIRSAVEEVEKRTGIRLQTVQQPPMIRGRVRTMLGLDSAPIAAVANVFQAQTGGRQQRDLRVTYPQLQEDLDTLPAHLVLIADGLGVKQAPLGVLGELFDQVGAVMTTAEAEDGMLADALESAIAGRGTRPTTRAPASAVVQDILERSTKVTLADIPLSPDAGRLALADYRQTHPELALELDARSGTLAWSRPRDAQQARALRGSFDPAKASGLFARLLKMRRRSSVPATGGGDLVLMQGQLPLDRVLPDEVVVGATSGSATEELVRLTARTAREVADAAIAVLLVSDAEEWTGTPAAQAARSAMATSVVVVDSEQLTSLASAISPRDAFVHLVLEQADLSKANPFTTTGATPAGMYFGRSREAADLRAALSTNSLALVGGRRIGKTSLMHRAVEMLRGDGWNAHYADCQEAGSWETFAALINLRWDAELESDFAPSQVAELVARLARRERNKRVVILLDEIDNLLRWDQTHDDGNVPEALFRACRALSQEGAAQFVFSGERFISERLWDPASPHWNFCRPLPVRQLGREDADALLSQPLRDLGIAIEDEAAFLQLSWARTEGHPHLTQVLGESLVLLLNDRRPEERTTLTPDDVDIVTGTVDFRRHYVETYWGQATAYERLVGALITSTIQLDDLRHELSELSVPSDGAMLGRALQMLDLYGVIDEGKSEAISLRATWLPDALEVFGGAAAVIDDELAQLNV